MSVHGSRGGGKNAESQVSISLPLHGSLHLLHHPTRNCKGLHLVHPDVRTVPVTVITTHTHTHRQSPSLMGMCTHCYHGNIPKWTYLYSSVWDRSWMSSSISRYAWEKTTKDIKPELRKGFDGHVTGSYLPFSLLLPSCGVSLPATVCPSHLQHTDTCIHTHTVITVHASVTK